MKFWRKSMAKKKKKKDSSFQRPFSDYIAIKDARAKFYVQGHEVRFEPQRGNMGTNASTTARINTLTTQGKLNPKKNLKSGIFTTLQPAGRSQVTLLPYRFPKSIEVV